METPGSQEPASRPRHILDLNKKEKIAFIESFDQILSDIDGVLWNIGGKIEGAVDGLKALSKHGKKYTFISNNSVRNEEQYQLAFKNVDLDVSYSDVIHPAKSIVNYLKSINFDGLIYCIGSSAFKKYIQSGGFNFIEGPNTSVSENLVDCAYSVCDHQPVRAVIIDVDHNLNCAMLMRAKHYLDHPDCILLSGATDDVLPITKDFRIIGPGRYLRLLQEASGKNPFILAKPGKELAEMLFKELETKNMNRILMIGDMLDQDIGFGKVGGMQTLLVLSGGTKKEQMLDSTKIYLRPDYYANSLADFVQFFMDY